MTKNRFFLAAVIVALAGCVQMPGPVITKELDGLRGQPVQVAFARLGYPNNQGEIAGEKFYVWSTENTAWFPSMSTTTATGMVGVTPFTYNQNSMGGGETMNFHCTIRIFYNDYA